VAFVPLTSSLKQTTLVLALFFYHVYYLRYGSNLHWELNPGLSFGVVAFVSVIPSLIQINLVLALFFYCLVSKLQEPPSLELKLKTIFQSFDLSKISS
jgi:lipoprotein signal peptidase